MENQKNLPEFSLEDIMREFSDHPDEIQDEPAVPDPMPELIPSEEELPVPEPLPADPEEAPEAPAPAQEEPEEAAQETAEAAGEPAPEAQDEVPAEEAEEVPAEAVPEEEPAQQPAGEAEAPAEAADAPAPDPKAGDADPDAPEIALEDDIPADILAELDAELEKEAEKKPFLTLRPRSKMQQLKHKLVEGPEKRYYELSELGLGGIQAAMLACALLVVLCVGATCMYEMGAVDPARMRLLVFSQVLAMLLSALVGCYALMDGIGDLLKMKFSLNTMLFATFLVCCADAVFCLQELRVPCCGAFSLEMFFALWNRYLNRYTEISQMDTLRKAVQLRSIVKVPDYFDGRVGIVHGEGQVEDFMENYSKPSGPEKVQNVYCLLSFLLCTGIAVYASNAHGSSLGVQIYATSLLAAVPVTYFVALSRPASILSRRLHMVGTVICGWKGVLGLLGDAVFPLRDTDIFPLGSTKLNGVKFYGDRNPDEVVSYASALICAEEVGLSPVFRQLMKTRSCAAYDAVNLIDYPGGGIGGEVRGEPVLVGSLNFMQDMGVEIPDGTMVNQAIYCAIDGQLCAVFAIAYAKMRSAAAGLVSLCSYHKITSVVLCGDFMVTESFLHSKFGVSTRRIFFPDQDVRRELDARMPEEGTPALALTTQDTLPSTAYAVTGARALRTAFRLGSFVHIVGGILGLLIMAALAILGMPELLTPFRVLMYQIVWMLPGLLIGSWTRTV